jgi:hypothetical protein
MAMADPSSEPQRGGVIVPALCMIGDVLADVLHICLVVFLVACALARKVQYINLVLVALTFLIVWPPAAYVVLALAAGALLSEESAQPAARDHRRRSIQGRRRSLQEPEWLRQAAASLLLPADSAEKQTAAAKSGEQKTATTGAAPALDAPASDEAADEGAPEWLLQAEATLASASTAPHGRPKKSPPRRAPSPTPPGEGSRVRTRGAARAKQVEAVPAAPPSAMKTPGGGPNGRTQARTPGSVKWADNAHSPPPSRARLHKMARAMNDDSSDDD